ncbi:MAG: hypothetical protein D4S02_12080 [Rhodocyclaceae bacterium]|nr:MAG: hypothetical protein D4S02_12080 [Rhodocyclaceae bacterium]
MILLLGANGRADEVPRCATTIGELRALLRDQAFPLKWEEISMDDGKPLMVAILEKHGSLALEFIKTREGLWAESTGMICQAGANLETNFAAGQIRLGPAANMLLRYALGNGGKFTLTRVESQRIRIATAGWNGMFSPSAK